MVARYRVALYLWSRCHVFDSQSESTCVVTLGSCSHSCASVIMQYHLVPEDGCDALWCEDNCRTGIALAMSHRLDWPNQLQPQWAYTTLAVRQTSVYTASYKDSGFSDKIRPELNNEVNQMRAGTHGGSQVVVIEDIKLKTFKQCRDIMNVGVSTEPLGQLLLT